jgi:hypothetical protein
VLARQCLAAHVVQKIAEVSFGRHSVMVSARIRDPNRASKRIGHCWNSGGI